MLTDRCVRDVRRGDLGDILAIDAAAFATPLNENELLDLLRQRRVGGYAHECYGRVLGYAIYEHGRAGAHLLRLAVDPKFRRQGVGTALVQKILSLPDGRRADITATVRESSLEAALFLRACGFTARLKRGGFSDTHEDAYVFTSRIQEEVCVGR